MKIRTRMAALLLAAALCAVPARAAATPDPVEEQYAQENTESYFQAYNEPIDREGFCYLVVSLMAELEETTVDQLYARLTDAQKEEAFDDVTDENKYISLAKKYELVVGSGVRSFSPQADAERQEVASILANFIQRMAPDHWDSTRDYTQGLNIEDHVEVADWAMQAVGYMVQCGLMPLDENDNFDPTGTMTVEEAVLLLSEFRLYLETPVETEQGVPGYVWALVGAGAGAAALAVLIVVLVRRSGAKKRQAAAREREREQALDEKLAPSQSPSGGNAAPRGGRSTQVIPAPRTGSGTVLLDADGRPRLHLVDRQNGLNRVFDLEQPLTAGRLEDNRLVLNDRAVSGHHCRFFWDGRQVLVEDAGARNPIWIQRGTARLAVPRGTPTPLENGDLLRLGAMQVWVELIAERTGR